MFHVYYAHGPVEQPSLIEQVSLIAPDGRQMSTSVPPERILAIVQLYLSSQVKSSCLFPIGAHKVRMQRAQHSKTRKCAASGALIEAEGCLELLRYAAPVGLISSWADLGLWPRRFPPERELTAPVSSVLSQGRCDIADLRAK